MTIVVVGGAVAQASGPLWFTKTPFAEYLEELSERWDKCIWLAEEHTGEPRFWGEIPRDVTVVPIRRGRRAWPEAWGRLARHLDANGVVLGFLPALLRYVPVLPLLKQRTSCFGVYLAGNWRDAESSMPRLDVLRRLGHRAAYAMALTAADVVIARGQLLAELAGRYNHHVVETVPIGHRFRGDGIVWPADSSEQRVLYVGKVLWTKGIGDLLEAFARVVAKGTCHDVRLDVVGDGADYEQVLELAVSLGLSNHVVFHGWVDDTTKLEKLFRAASVVVVPSRRAAGEGVPRVIDEALSCGRPVIATALDGIVREYTTTAVDTVRPEAPGELAARICAVLDDEMELASRRGAARRWAESARAYTETAGQQHTNVLRSLLGRRGERRHAGNVRVFWRR